MVKWAGCATDAVYRAPLRRYPRFPPRMRRSQGFASGSTILVSSLEALIAIPHEDDG